MTLRPHFHLTLNRLRSGNYDPRDVEDLLHDWERLDGIVRSSARSEPSNLGRSRTPQELQDRMPR